MTVAENQTVLKELTRTINQLVIDVETLGIHLNATVMHQAEHIEDLERQVHALQTPKGSSRKSWWER